MNSEQAGRQGPGPGNPAEELLHERQLKQAAHFPVSLFGLNRKRQARARAFRTTKAIIQRTKGVRWDDPLRKRMTEELQLRNRSPKYFNKSPQNLGAEQVREYLLHLIRDNQAMPGTVLVNRAAPHFVYVCTLKQNWFEDEIPHPKRRLTLPGILSAEEAMRMLDSTYNLKHWSILATFYATALRCSELQHLRVDDIDSKRMVLHVREGEGPSSS